MYNFKPNKDVYYIGWVSNDSSQTKLYQQLREVNYAKYKIGKWYIEEMYLEII